MVTRVKAVQYGCGPIGCSVVRFAAQRPDIELVGAIDIDKNLVGRDLGEVAGLDKKLGVGISDDADAVLSQTKPEVVFLTTSSSVKKIYPQLEQCARAGANVVSTCEELSFPFRKDPQLSTDIDKLAKANDVTILGTGVNPGFLMDTWPLTMTGVCQQVKQIKVVRVQNASSRRGPSQKKIGAGCTLAEFDELVAAGTLRHVGLAESIAMIASGLGWELDDISESIEPVIAGSIRMAMGDPIRGGRLKLYFTDGEEQDITAGDLGLEASQQCLKEALVKGGLWVIFFGFGLQCLVIGCLWYFKKAPDEEITEVSTDHRDVDTSSAKETLQENQDHTELSGVWSFVILGVGIGLVMHGLLSFVSRMGNRKQRGS